MNRKPPDNNLFEVFQMAIQSGIIDIDQTSRKVEELNKKKALEQHPYSIYFREATGYWYTHLPERHKKVLTDNRALFGSRDNNRISVAAVHRLVKKALLQAGLDATQFSAHKLRHTAATMMLSGGVDVKTVQEVLGHENLNTTQIYTHIENTELKLAAEANPLSKLDFSDEK